MKRIFLLLVLLLPCMAFSQSYYYGQGKQVIVTSDTVNINKTDRYTYFYTVDNLFYFSNNGILKQIATENDSISLANVYVDTLKGRLQDSIFVADDLVALYDILFEGTTSNKMYFEDTDGDTVIVIDPNMSGNPSIYMMDGTAADSVRVYHDGTNLKIVPDEGTTKIDVDGTLEADSLNAGGSTDYVGIGNATTGMINVVAATAGDYTVLKVSGAGINDGSDNIIYIGAYDNWKGSGKLSATQLEILQKAVINDSLRVEETALIKGALTANVHAIVNDSLRVEETSLLKGAVTANTKLVVNDSLRVEETSLLKGTVTTAADIAVGTKAVVNDSLRVEETSLLKGTVTTAADIAVGTKAVVNDSLRVEETALIKGALTANLHAIVNDSLRVEETSLLKGDVTLNEDLFIDDSLDVDGVLQVSPVVDSVAINGKLYVSGTASLGTISADSLNLRELTVTDSAYVDTLTTAVARVTGKAVIEDSLRVEETSLLKGAVTANTKLVVNDSLRIEETALIKGITTLNNRTNVNVSGSTIGVSVDGNVTSGNLAQFINDNDGSVGDSSAYISSTGKGNFLGGLQVGNSTVADQQDKDYTQSSDADLDVSATTTETLTLSLTPNATPTLATWDFTSTQSLGYKFDKNVGIGIGSASPVANSLTLGTKGTQRDLIVTRENTPAGTDSSLKISISSGNPRIDFYAGTGATGYLEWDSSDRLTLYGGGSNGLYLSSSSLLIGSGYSVNSSGSEPRFYFGGTYTAFDILDRSGADYEIRFGKGATAGKYSRIDSAGVFYSPSDQVTLGSAITVGKNSGTSGEIDFVASDNDQANIAINTSDQITFNAAGGGYTFDAAIESDNIRDLGNDGVLTIGSTGNMTLDVVGTGNSYVEVIQDNNAGYLAVGRTTATEASMLSITDGGADNTPGFLQLFDDGGSGNYFCISTAKELRGKTSAFADDDAEGYAIINLSTGAIGASTQAVNGSTVTGTTITDGTISITGGALTGATSVNATNVSNGTTTNGDGNPGTNWSTVKIYCDSTIAGEVTLTDVLPAGYTIETIIFKNTTVNEITNLDIGFSDGGGEVVAAGNVTASDEGSFTILQKVDDFDAADTLYISAANWNSANLIIYIRMHRMF